MASTSNQPAIAIARSSLTVICGPMFAGKSSELMRRAIAARAQCLDVSVFKPRRDTRYAEAAIVTHAGESLACIVIDVASELAELAGQAPGASARSKLVLIDEAHFFGADLVEPVLQLVRGGVSVVIAGLETDHRGMPFEPFPRLLCEANEVCKLSCPCSVCGHAAVYSQRLVDSSERIVVGGAGEYEPRCRACFVPGR